MVEKYSGGEDFDGTGSDGRYYEIKNKLVVTGGQVLTAEEMAELRRERRENGPEEK